MAERLGIIADDLTGANDTSAQFAGRGVISVVAFGPLDMPATVGVVALDTDSRRADPRAAAAAAAAGARLVRTLGATRFYKKVDSTLRGHLGPELEAVMDVLGVEAALVAPAFPANGRITAGGYHLLHQVPVAESEVARDPVTPVAESRLPMLLAQSCRRRVGRVDLSILHEGLPALATEVASLKASGVQVIACDATTDAHLELLAELLWRDETLLGCGSAGLARALAERGSGSLGGALGKASGGSLAPAVLPGPPSGGTSFRPLFVVAGTRSRTTAAQIEAFREGGATVVPVEALDLLADGGAELERAAARQAAAALAAGQHTVLYLSLSSPVVQQPEASRRLTLAMGRMAAEVLVMLGGALPVAGLVLTGGDTAKAVCGELGVQGIEIERELDPAVALGRCLGGRYPGLRVVTKGGACGGPGILALAAGELQ
ncbi:MAG: four-carbon acid sugar kinase family protein [Chitinophagales bacterium]